jgi:transposase
MFVREIKHSNGKTYIQVIEKLHGKYIVKKSFGSANTAHELKLLIFKARKWIKNINGIQEFDFNNERELFDLALSSITSHKLVGIDLVLGKIFDDIGFNLIDDELFRDLVLYRLVYPKSKLKTTEYLLRYAQKSYSEDDIYRYMDKLRNIQQELVQRISYEHTLKILTNSIQVVFYDVTTIYFETDYEDDLRKTGFSKEGRHQNPQIVLGLLVSEGGYPLAYDIFEGKQYEGHTMMPIINGFKEKFNLEKLVVVADSGLLSNDNINELISNNYEFILGARIKNENQDIKDKITALSLKNGESKAINKDGLKLIIAYSDDRAKKDKHNREKGIKRLNKSLKSGKLTKSSINNRGYNKFLEMDGEINLKINTEKIKADEKWDGLKGYITNSNLNKTEVLANYRQLWLIEKAFRIAKTDLKIRPIFHFKKERIEAHICLNFVAYKVFKELERQLKVKRANFSPEKVIEIIQSIFEIEITTPTSKEIIKKTLLITEEQKQISEIFEFSQM